MLYHVIKLLYNVIKCYNMLFCFLRSTFKLVMKCHVCATRLQMPSFLNLQTKVSAAAILKSTNESNSKVRSIQHIAHHSNLQQCYVNAIHCQLCFLFWNKQSNLHSLKFITTYTKQSLMFIGFDLCLYFLGFGIVSL